AVRDDDRLARDPRGRPDPPPLRLRRGPRRGARRRGRARRAASGRADDGVPQGEARRPPVPRRQPQRARADGRAGVRGAAPPGRAGRDPAALAGGRRRRAAARPVDAFQRARPPGRRGRPVGGPPARRRPAAAAGLRTIGRVPAPGVGQNGGMESLRGQLLIASPKIVDPNFRRVVVYMAEHTDEGAMGLVLNRPAETTVPEAVPDLEWLAEGDGEAVWVGGPVSPGAVIVLAEFDDPERAAL